MLTIGSLFSGVGGLELGLEWAGLGPVVWQVERDAYCRSVLARHWPAAARVGNVRLFHPDRWGRRPREWGRVDLICGGFPCQDVSGAGKGAGLAGARSGLWREFARIVGEFLPAYVVVENVASGANRWVDAVVRDLAQLGYAALPLPLSASDVGAPHRRARIFVVAQRVCDASGGENREQPRRSGRPSGSGAGLARQLGEEVAHAAECPQFACGAEAGADGSSEGTSGGVGDPVREHEREPLAAAAAERDDEPQGPASERASRLGDGDGDGREAQRGGGLLDGERPAFGYDADGSSGAWPWPPGPGDADGWAEWLAEGGPEPAVRRGAHGLPCGMARREWERQLRALGNAVCPQQGQVVGEFVRLLVERNGAMTA